MSAPIPEIRALVAYAQENGRAALAAIRSAQFTILNGSGGVKVLTGVSAGGKSFNYTVPPDTTVTKLMALAQEALEYYDTLSDDERNTLTTRAPIRRTRGTFF